MEWREVGAYRGAVIWVRRLRAGCWVVAVAPVPALAEGEPAHATPSEEMVLPAGFPSQAASVEGARRHIDRAPERPAEHGPPSDEDARVRPPGSSLRVRHFARFPVSLPVLVRTVQFPGRDITGKVRNVGAGGMMAELPVHMEAGRAVALLLQTRSGPRELEARVVWSAAAGETVRHGCSFTTVQGPDFAVELFIQEMR